MQASACAVGRLVADGPWIGFAPSLDGGYLLVIEGSTDSRPATPVELLSLAVLYFEESIEEPPETLAATHGDIGALVRHIADSPRTPAALRGRLVDAIDAIDDGLAADVVLTRLQAALGPGTDPRELVAARTRAVGGW